LVRWIGPEATADPGDRGRPVRGGGPYRRLVFTYGWEDGRMGVPPESTTVEVDLVERDGATIVRLVHRGLRPQARRRLPALGTNARREIYGTGATKQPPTHRASDALEACGCSPAGAGQPSSGP
jgi:hypothetical protein